MSDTTPLDTRTPEPVHEYAGDRLLSTEYPQDKPESQYDGFQDADPDDYESAYLPDTSTIDALATAYLRDHGWQEPTNERPVAIPAAPYEAIPGFIISPDAAYDTHTGTTWPLLDADWYVHNGARCIDLADDYQDENGRWQTQTITLRVPFSHRDLAPNATEDNPRPSLRVGRNPGYVPTHQLHRCRSWSTRDQHPLASHRYVDHVVTPDPTRSYAKWRAREDERAHRRHTWANSIHALRKRKRDRSSLIRQQYTQLHRQLTDTSLSIIERKPHLFNEGTRHKLVVTRDLSYERLRDHTRYIYGILYPAGPSHRPTMHTVTRIKRTKQHVAINKRTGRKHLVRTVNINNTRAVSFHINGRYGYMSPETARKHYTLEAA